MKSRVALGLTLAALLGGLGGWTLRSHPTSDGRSLQRGPWGALYAWTIRLEPPTEFFGSSINFSYQGKWHFPGQSIENVRVLMSQAGLAMADIEKLAASAQTTADGKGVVLLPDVGLLLSLKPEVRANLYFKLAEWPENEAQANPRVYTEESFRESFEDSPLNVVETVRHLLYADKSLMYFADAKSVFDGLSNEDEKRRFLRSISHARAQLVKLRIKHGEDVRAIAEYWHNESKAKDHEVLLESIARRPEGGEIDVVHLLPRFARKLLFTYPPPSERPASEWKNCHWTSLNLFSGDTPDDSFLDPQKVAAALKNDYVRVEGAPKLGDLVLFEKAGQVIHTANYVAADVLFTKNGNSALRPWVLMQQEDVKNFYSLPGPPLSIRYFRKK